MAGTDVRILDAVVVGAVSTAEPSGVDPAAAQVQTIFKTAQRSQLANVLRVDWLGQTAASLCWIASVFIYGISSAADWLQLAAASAWLVANIAAALATEAD